jgi:hypothetical protein
MLMVIKKNRVVLMLLFFVLVLFFMFPSVSAHFRDDRIEVLEYISYQTEDGGWHDWIGFTGANRSLIFPTLKVGQAIRLKIIATPFEIGSFSFFLDEPGRIKAYDVVDVTGSPETTRIQGSAYVFEPIEANTRVEYIYTLIVNGNWTGGSCATVEVYWSIAFKGKPGQIIPEPEDIRRKSFGLCGNILNEQWTGPTYRPSDLTNNGESTNDSTPSSSIPGFTLPALLLSLIGVSYFIKKKRRIKQ